MLNDEGGVNGRKINFISYDDAYSPPKTVEQTRRLVEEDGVLLMLNPLDAFRVHALFALEQIPAEAANKTPLANWWITHAALWFLIISAAWSFVATALATMRLNRWED